MGRLHLDGLETVRDHTVQAQLCAYNMAFSELGLRFRWDAQTFASLATIDDERARIAAYIKAHHSHLLNAYSAEFLSQAILDRKNAHTLGGFAANGKIANVSRASDSSQGYSRRACVPDEPGVPALAGA
ncbi:hypothetical protein OKW41_006435 [Paraburkholderia sp. UCT70]|uniref:hypothetical protein n=1 Tax=Paraburkholderia sp. UCT70 TaxID=2991068 RepID=UPI003D2244BA